MTKKYNIFVIKETTKNIFVVKIRLFFLIMIFTFSSQSLNHASVSMKQHILKKNGMKPLETALSMAVYCQNIDFFVLGVDSVNQLQEILKIMVILIY